MVVGLDLAPPRLVQDVEHLAVDVQLELRAGCVADPDRLRPLVARQPRQLAFREVPLTGRAVHDLQVVRVAGDGSQQPAAPGPRLVLEAVLEQGVEGERRVTEPAVPVVPVADAADLLRQRGRRSRHDPARRIVGERLQHHQRPRHGLLPAAAVRAVAEPLSPERAGLLQRLLRIDRCRRLVVGGVPGEHERLSLSGLDCELRDGAEVLAAHRDGCAQRQRRPGPRSRSSCSLRFAAPRGRSIRTRSGSPAPSASAPSPRRPRRSAPGRDPCLAGGMKSITRTIPASVWKSSSWTSVRSR